MKSKIKEVYRKARALAITRPGWRKFAMIGLSVLFLGLLIPVLLIFSVKWGAFGSLPSEKTLQNITNNVASEVYAADNTLIGKYYYQNRTNTKHENISPYLLEALIATEDARFYEHDGIDLRSWFRVFFKTILLNEDAGGGSTISQQLVKNLFGRDPDEWLVITKIKEAIIAQQLEDIYTKDEIITLYLNTVPFGEDVYGVETAAERFFNTTAKDVSLQEAATLVGMLKANSYFNPRQHPERSLLRRNVVLNQMVKYDYLEEDIKDSVKLLPMETDVQIISTNTGLATYFREHLRQELEEWCRTHKKADGTPYNLYTDGLKIYTTLDPNLQKFAEEAVNNKMKELQKVFFDHWKNRKPWTNNTDIVASAVRQTPLYQSLQSQGKSSSEINKIFAEKKHTNYFTYEGEKEKLMSSLDSIQHHLMFLHAGLLSINPQDGQVKAWVGGINHKFFKYDHVNVKTRRQVGSTFKPIVYTAALQQGLEPCKYISASQETYVMEDGEEWSPANSESEYEMKYSLAGALLNSVNTVSVKVLYQTGIENIIQLAKDMGIESEIPEVPSIALGTIESSLFEMTKSYCTFANDGRPISPIYLLEITDENGKILEKFHPDVTKDRVIDEQTNSMMIEMMEGVVNEGTAARLRWKYNISNDIAGKTGTTQNNADGWFIGVTPKLVTGVWVGANDPRIRFRSTYLGQGASTALPIFAEYFQKINKAPEYDHIEKASFPPLSEDLRVHMDCPPSKEEAPSLFELLFGDKNRDKKKDEEEEDDDENFFERLFKRRN